MRCPVCRLDHGGEGGQTRMYSVTRAGYLALATWRAEDARKQTAGDSYGEPAQATGPSPDATRTGWGESASVDAAAARWPTIGGHDA